MRELKTLTHILLTVFIGIFIAGVICDNRTACVWGVVLTVIDVIAGMWLQLWIDEKEEKTDSWNRMSTKEKLNYIRSLGNEEDSEKTLNANDCGILCKKSICMDFDRAFCELKEYEDGIKIRGMNDIMFNSAGLLLVTLCAEMKHAPTPEMLSGLKSISAYDGENGIILYGFDNFKFKTGELAAILLVHHNKRIRFFTLELSLSGVVLCEYSGYSHINHGYVDVRKISLEIKRILYKS